MQCPVCHVDLTMTDRQGVEIDYCPRCRGVWLDRGELDKIIERSNGVGNVSGGDHGEQHHEPSRSYDSDNYRKDDRGHEKKKERGGMLGDLFDF